MHILGAQCRFGVELGLQGLPPKQTPGPVVSDLAESETTGPGVCVGVATGTTCILRSVDAVHTRRRGVKLLRASCELLVFCKEKETC